MKIISGDFKGRKINTPQGLTTRPTSSRLREALFNICQHTIAETEFLDLFAGSGAMGFEALSRGAKGVTFVENNRFAAECIEKTATELGIKEKIRLFQTDVFVALKKMISLNKSFDFIYVDPPYDLSYGQKVIDCVDDSNLLREGGFLFIEESAKVQLKVEELKTLELVSSRNAGRSSLFQFRKIGTEKS